MINKWTGIGNLGKDAEFATLPSGSGVLNFSMATVEKWKENDEWKEKTEWHKIAVFGRLAETLKLSKGNLVYAEGKIQNNEYTDNNNVKHYSYKIVASVVRNLTPKERDKAESGDLAE
jgi:single-strand DNA-binding protein